MAGNRDDAAPENTPPWRALADDPTLRLLDHGWNNNPLHEIIPVDWAEAAHALRTVWLHALADPGRAAAAAAQCGGDIWTAATAAWADAARQWWGLAPIGDPAAPDKRFAAPEWQGNPAFRTLKDSYLRAAEWLMAEAAQVEALSPAERQRLEFHLRQFIAASNPALTLAGNPDALRRLMETGGASLASGMRNLLHDLRAGRLSMVDTTAFAPGRNLALSPGRVIFRNALIELIQYAPATPAVRTVPLLILPPWINKFYILDLQPRNSLVRFLVERGFTVFMVSWKNPDAAMQATTIEDYVELGPMAASEVAREITGSEQLNVMGYCIGGTLLAMVLALLARRQDRRFAAASFIVSLLDFAKVGDTAVFMDDPTIDFVERQMLERGYLDSRAMSNMFNLLRADDLIWSNVVNNYLLGNPPPAFDLLYWNNDGTRMARAAHSWYLRNTYVENNLVRPGAVRLMGEALDLGRVANPIYAVGTERDHIVPWEAAWRTTRLLGGPARFTLASSGHIAGIINPPGGKGAYWSGEVSPAMATPAQWRAAAARHDGSWWEDWAAWLAGHSGPDIAPPALGSNRYPPLGEAPGTYVFET